MWFSKVKIPVKVTTLEPKVTVLSAQCALFISSFYMGHEALLNPRITFEPHSTLGKSVRPVVPISTEGN